MEKVKLSLLWQITNATPNNQWELAQIEELFENLEYLSTELEIKYSMHFPGSFLEFLAEKSPAYIAWLRNALKEERLEVVGGAYNDALLPLWPYELQKLQLQRQQEVLRKYLGLSPRGWHCPSLAWEISMVHALSQKAYEYTVLSDESFAKSLALPLPIAGWRTIENQGEVIRAFPCNSSLSSSWSQGDLAKFIEGLTELSSSDRALLIRLPLNLQTGQDSKSKFTFAQDLLSEIKEHKLELQWWLPSRAIDQIPPKGPLSLITALGTDLGLPRTVNTCRELLNRRPESNIIHKRVLHAHRRARQVLEWGQINSVENMLLPVQSARFYRNLPDHLGINQLENRILAHEMLIKAEKKIDRLSERSLRLDVMDFLANGSRQIVAASGKIAFVLEHLRGGILRTFDNRKINFNWLVGQRESGEPAAALQDYLLPLEAPKVTDILNWVEEEYGVLNAPYDYQIKRQNERLQILLSGDQSARINEKKQVLRISKVVGFRRGDEDLQVSWQITNATFNVCKANFTTEILGAFGNENRRNQYFLINGKKTSWSQVLKGIKEVKIVEFVHRGRKISLTAETHKPCIFIVAPIMGSGEGAAPQQFQGYRMIFAWDINLKGQESATLHLRLAMGRKGLLK